jgi:hypothetical protein
MLLPHFEMPCITALRVLDVTGKYSSNLVWVAKMQQTQALRAESPKELFITEEGKNLAISW